MKSKGTEVNKRDKKNESSNLPSCLFLPGLLYVACVSSSTESPSPLLTALAGEDDDAATAEHDVNVAEPSNVKSPPEL